MSITSIMIAACTGPQRSARCGTRIALGLLGRKQLVPDRIERITARSDGITIQWHEQGLNKLLRDTLTPERQLEAA